VNTNLEHVVRLRGTDVEYRFGKPKAYRTTHELAWLMLLRSRLGGTQRERGRGGTPHARGGAYHLLNRDKDGAP
jgi:hypothetical protein